GRMPLWDANAAAQKGARGTTNHGAAGAGLAAGTSQPSSSAAQSAASSPHAGQTTSAAEANAAARLAAISAGLSGKPSATAQAGEGAGVDGERLKMPEGMVGMLAQSLGETVWNSGLFCESDLAQMVFGKRGLADRLKEPQALLARTGTQAGGAANAGNAPT